MTEKQYAPSKIEKKTQKINVKTQKPTVKKKTPEKKEEKLEEKKSEKVAFTIKDKPVSKETQEKKETKPVEKPEEKKEKKKEVKIKKDSAFVDAKNLPISTKQAVGICKFIKNKPVQKAINELEEVAKLRKAVPMKGEIAHRKGKIMSGKFPVRAAEHFITILKGLQGNANQNNIDEPIIKEAIANKAQRPFARFGRHQKKRSHAKIIVFEKKVLREMDKKKAKKKMKKTIGEKK